MSDRALTNLRSEFPMLTACGEFLSYLDNAATTQKPKSVIDRIANYYRHENANIHRGVYQLSENATQEYHQARTKVKDFIGASDDSEIIFTRGTTESVNLVAATWGEANLKSGDEILLTVAEHHSNIVPWQMLARRVGATIKYIPLNDKLRLDLDAAKKLISPKTKLVSLAHVSNVLGIVHPIEDIIRLAKEFGAVVFIDGAQGIPHFKINVQELGCDFYAFSGHKMLGPTGIGVLFGKANLLEAMPPYQGGGDMIDTVSLDGSTWAPIPQKFEAGTPHISGAIGLGAAIDYLNKLPRESLLQHDMSLGRTLIDELRKNPAIKLFADGGDDWVGVVSFHHNKIHPHDLAAIADSENVCVRAGHHCAQPLMHYLGVPATTRISPYMYNTQGDIERFLRALAKAEKLLT